MADRDVKRAGGKRPVAKEAPYFTDEMLSGDETLTELGIGNTPPRRIEGWQRDTSTLKDPDEEVAALFSRRGVRNALRRAFVRLTAGDK